jgi:hypothetical protein
MRELNDHDLRKLFQEAGRQQPASDLTGRIMARVAVTRMHAPLVVKPLISRTGWVVITCVVLVLVGLVASVPAGAGTASSSLLGPVLEWLPRIGGTPIQWPTGPWVYWAAAVAGCLLLLSLMDRALERARN